MEWLNYHHLLYFWTVAKEGSIARACEKLLLAQPTISGQLRMLEASLGEKLFARQGRGLRLTEVGQVVFRYAEEIFALGRELQDVLKGSPPGRPLRLTVGISDMVPKLIAYRVLEPSLKMSQPVRLICHEDGQERLLAELAEHRLDVVLSDAPVTTAMRVKAFNHLLGASGVTLFGTASLAKRYRRDFPKRLNGAPFLLPADGCSLRRSLEQWLEAKKIIPARVGEFKDRALMKAFGSAGAGLFPAPTAIEAEVKARYRVTAVGRLDSVIERFYAISIERKLKHPAAVTICETAANRLFGEQAAPPLP
ncbi:MAG TPA: transcriptional activator NhaR [Bryobacteraceae bacterium]|jgi:LysR family transcriptional activator of nhaA|nr:transcriptional activator NhaR [Bryobacteraceae bacterium]